MKNKIQTLVFLLLIIGFLQAQEAKLVLPIGHTDDLIGYEITPNGKYLITASEDATGKIWNYRTGKFMYDLKLHSSYLTGIELSKDGSFVVLASADGSYSKWDVESGKLLFHSTPKASIRQMFLLPGDSTVLLVKDYVMVIGNFRTTLEDIFFDEIYEYYSDDKVKRVAISPDAKTIAIHQKQHPLKIFNWEDGTYKPIGTIEKIYLDSIRYYSLSKIEPDFLFFTANNEVAGSFNGRMMAGFSTDSLQPTFFYPKTVGRGFKLNRDRTLMAFKTNVYKDDSVRIWDTRLKKLKATIPVDKKFELIKLSELSSNIILCYDNTVQEWSAEGKLIHEREFIEREYPSLYNSQEQRIIPSVLSIDSSETIAFVEMENGLQTINWKTGKTLNEFIGKVAAVKKTLISKNAQWLFELKEKYSNYWNLNLMKANRFPEYNNQSVKQLYLTHFSDKVLLQYNSSFSLFDCSKGVIEYTNEGDQIYMLNGDATFITVNKKLVKKWSVITGQILQEWEMPNTVNNIAVSNNDSLLAYINSDERNNDSVFVWNLEENKLLTSFKRPSQHIEGGYLVIYTSNYTPALHFSNDNKYIFFSSGETGWLSIAKLPYEEYVKYDDFVDTIRYELDLIHDEGILEFFSKRYPIAIMEKEKIVLISADIESSVEDEIRAYNYEKGVTDFRLRYPEFQKILLYDSVKNRLFTATKTVFLEWDLVQRTLIKKWIIPTGMSAVAVIKTKKQFLIVSNDRIGILPMDSTKPTYFFSTLDENETAVVRNDRFYKVTPNAVTNLSWNIGQKFYDFDQWDLQYHRPDKVMELVERNELTNAYYMAYKKRLTKNGLTEEAFKQVVALPQITILNRITDGELLTDSLFTLKVKITPSGKKNDVQKVFVLINGNPVFGKDGYATTVKKELEIELPLTLSESLNNIKASCMDKNGNESIREQLHIVYKPITPHESKMHFIGIGINQFANPEYNLSWSVKDIRDLALKLKTKYPNIIIDTLFDSNVTKENILALKQKLLQLKEDDKVIVSYSGHGVLSKDFDYFLSTYSIDFTKPEERGLAYDDLESLLDNIKPRKKLMLIDACHSGEVDKEEIAKIEAAKSTLSNNGVITKSTIKVVKKEKQLGMANSFELMQSLFVNVGKGTGATIISAAGGMQYAQERGDLKNGVFTYSLIEAFNQNQSLKVSELKKKVGERVIELTNGLQKPTSRNETNNYDWVVW